MEKNLLAMKQNPQSAVYKFFDNCVLYKEWQLRQ